MFTTLYGRLRKDTPVFRYKIGDLVRVSKVRNVFSKGYEQNYTEEFFTIAACIPRTPPVYRLQEYDGILSMDVFMKKNYKKSL